MICCAPGCVVRNADDRIGFAALQIARHAHDAPGSCVIGHYQLTAAEDLAETLGIVFATGDCVNAIPVSRATIATASNEHC